MFVKKYLGLWGRARALWIRPWLPVRMKPRKSVTKQRVALAHYSAQSDIIIYTIKDDKILPIKLSLYN